MNPKERWSDEAIDRTLADLCHAPAPESFGPGWRAAIRREERMQMKKKSMFWRTALPVAAALVLVVGTLATGDWGALESQPNASVAQTEKAAMSVTRSMSGPSSPNSNMLMAESANYATDASADTGAAMSGGAGDIAAATDNSDARKLVRTASLRLASADYDRDSAAVRALAESLGGYVEGMDEYTRDDGSRVIDYALRIPSGQLDAFLEGAEGMARVTGRSESATDMSTQYADTALRLQTQRDKLERLRELMKQATAVADLLEIESAIADAQYQIDAYESALRSIDRRVEDSQVSVRVTEETPAEAAQAVELTLGDRLSNGLSASFKAIGLFLQNLAVFVVMCLPVLIPLAAATVIVWLIVRARRKKRHSSGESQE